MDWTIITSVLGGALGASLITAFVNWRMKVREEKHEAERWKREKRLALYTKVTTLHRKLDDLSTRFAASYADVLAYQKSPGGDEAGLQEYKHASQVIFDQMREVMREVDIETNLSFMVASREITKLLNRYGSTATKWVQIRFEYLDGQATEETARQAEKAQSDAWQEFIIGARSDLGF